MAARDDADRGVDRELILLAMAMAVCGPLVLALGVSDGARRSATHCFWSSVPSSCRSVRDVRTFRYGPDMLEHGTFRAPYLHGLSLGRCTA
jgi:hypothetical protein